MVLHKKVARQVRRVLQFAATDDILCCNAESEQYLVRSRITGCRRHLIEHVMAHPTDVMVIQFAGMLYGTFLDSRRNQFVHMYMRHGLLLSSLPITYQVHIFNTKYLCTVYVLCLLLSHSVTLR